MTNKLKEMAGKILEINKTVISESNPATVYYKSCELDRHITILAVQLAQLVIEQEPISQRECYQRGYKAGAQEQREQDAKMVEERGKKLGRAIDPAITANAIRAS